ncbi:uncharacterized protein BDR25DRAFT_356163 [Lindgomyces ingoldianus]|uniref:Uncharacterized protein n=1 Tax=Lindgomyces ingoldianus TaxID=673940 RepID=A0ACB6QSA7_9PLEO|nr:uncharacterized protein BDR25DRAFT_356163 [Lindgomyces ingoldianus]KAF2469893.1 hypothetical protein BDR25DRAFT_356163 [Lindgomyces ingoldianus]
MKYHLAVATSCVGASFGAWGGCAETLLILFGKLEVPASLQGVTKVNANITRQARASPCILPRSFQAPFVIELVVDALPSARLFLEPGYELSQFNTICVVLHDGYQEIIGRYSDVRYDKLMLSSCLSLLTKSEYSSIRRKKDQSIFLRQTAVTARTELLSSICQEFKQDTLETRPTIPSSISTFRAERPSVWTVDFDQHVIFLDQLEFHAIHLFCIPQAQPTLFRTSRRYRPVDLPVWKPSHTTVSHTSIPLTAIPVSDYDSKWRAPGFASSESESGFTLNFKTQVIGPNECVKYMGMLNIKLDGSLVQPREPANLLRWRIWPIPPVVPTVGLGNTQVLFTEHIEQAYRLVQEHFMEVVGQTYPLSSQFWTLSMSFHQSAISKSSRKLITLLNAHHYVAFVTDSVRYIKLLDAYPLFTRMHKLPTELQEIILSYAGEGEINRAVYASILGVDVPFT